VKKLKRWLSDIFDPKDYNNLDTDSIRAALNDASVRTVWLSRCFDDLKQMNQEVDKRLLSGTNVQLTDLCARRKAYQDMLEAILSARRQVAQGTQEVRPNQRPNDVNLDRVTA
jgi:hypothetical protein